MLKSLKSKIFSSFMLLVLMLVIAGIMSIIEFNKVGLSINSVMDNNYKSIEQILDKKRSKVIGKFGCKGYDTFGPFKLVGGIAKGHPDEEDIKNAVEFVKGL